MLSPSRRNPALRMRTGTLTQWRSDRRRFLAGAKSMSPIKYRLGVSARRLPKYTVISRCTRFPPKAGPPYPAANGFLSSSKGKFLLQPSQSSALMRSQKQNFHAKGEERMSPKAKSAGRKAAQTRKRRAAGKKAAAKRKHRAAGIKAAAKRKHRAAGIKAAAKRKHRAAGTKAKATLEAKKQQVAAPAAAPPAAVTTEARPAAQETEELPVPVPTPPQE